jgi:hypothetical protein
MASSRERKGREGERGVQLGRYGEGCYRGGYYEQLGSVLCSRCSTFVLLLRAVCGKKEGEEKRREEKEEEKEKNGKICTHGNF